MSPSDCGTFSPHGKLPSYKIVCQVTYVLHPHPKPQPVPCLFPNRRQQFDRKYVEITSYWVAQTGALAAWLACTCTCSYMISQNARRRGVSRLTSFQCRHSHVPFSSPLKACTRSQTRRASSCRVMAAASEDLKQWPQQDKRRFLHAVYRVGNLDATIDYYKKHFGMKQLRYRDVPEVSGHAQHLLHTQLCTALLNYSTCTKLCCLQVKSSCALLLHRQIDIH